MASIDSLNNFYQKNSVFINAKLDKGRIKVPIQVNGKTYYFMFDTGSSMFPLITAKKDISVFNKQGEVKESVKTSSWGTKYNVSGYTIDNDVLIGNLKLNKFNNFVYENPLKAFEQFFKQEDILGIMGNAFFLDKEIIIDFKNKRFGVVKTETE